MCCSIHVRNFIALASQLLLLAVLWHTPYEQDSHHTQISRSPVFDLSFIFMLLSQFEESEEP